MRVVHQPDTDETFEKEVTIRATGTFLNLRVVGRGQSFDATRAREIYDAIGATMGFYKPTAKKRPNGPQVYRGNGRHKWEEVSVDARGAGHTYRLRVPGGFIYRTVSVGDFGDTQTNSTVFVPMPDEVGYVI